VTNCRTIGSQVVFVDCIEGNLLKMEESHRINLYTNGMINHYVMEDATEKTDGSKKMKRKIQKGTYKKKVTQKKGPNKLKLLKNISVSTNHMLLFYNYDCT
jgi:hypothetical protein